MCSIIVATTMIAHLSPCNLVEMLSYLESRSSAYVLRVEERVSRPDENYAREIMQLFTMGLEMLRPDGSVIQVDGAPVATYENSDIQNVSSFLFETPYFCRIRFIFPNQLSIRLEGDRFIFI